MDIVGTEGPWVTQDEAKELRPALMMTVGRVLSDEPGYLILAGTVEVGGDQQYGHVHCIPRGVIAGIRHLIQEGGGPPPAQREAGVTTEQG